LEYQVRNGGKKMEETKSPSLVLNRKSAAEFLGGICLTTLARLKIPQVHIRRRVFYRIADLDKWLAEHTIKLEAEK
jgi:hypothetical protein